MAEGIQGVPQQVCTRIGSNVMQNVGKECRVNRASTSVHELSHRCAWEEPHSFREVGLEQPTGLC